MLDTSSRLGQNSKARQIVAEQLREAHHKYNVNGGLSNGIIQNGERSSSLHAADGAQQNVDVDRTAGCQCRGLLRYRSFLVA